MSFVFLDRIVRDGWKKRILPTLARIRKWQRKAKAWILLPGAYSGVVEKLPGTRRID
ncbi:MAG: hypothetical protein O2971_07005 [Proteobacteria bacterium]|nr:hypothetical protein [Pseudomonadota bacterium]